MMGARTCDREPEVVAMMAAGGQDPAISQHLARCAICRELAEVAGWMHELARVSPERHELPSPGQIWWKAQLIQRWEAERQATAPIENMQRMELIGGIGGLVALFIWYWPTLLGLVSRAQTGTPTMWSSVMVSFGPLLAVVIGGLILALMVFAVFDRFLAEE